METQFEIAGLSKKEHYVECNRFFMKKRFISVAICACAGVHAIDSGIELRSLLLLLLGIYGIGLSLWIYFRPWLVAEREYKRVMDYAREKGPRNLTSFGECIVDEAQDVTVKMYYDKVLYVHIGEQVIFIVDGRKLALMCSRDGFQKGNEDDFLKFIREKCPQAKITRV